MSMLDLALTILKETENEITQVELLNKISEATGYSKESVRGSIIGDASHKLFGQPYFKRYWRFCRVPARMVRASKAFNSSVYKMDYDTTPKRVARDRLFRPIKNRKNAKILTMGGEQGHCVKQLLNINKNFNIHNVEYSQTVLDKFTSKFPQIESFSGYIGEHLRNYNNYDFVYYDSLSYACSYMNDDFIFINNNTNIEYIAITLMNIKRFRNHGKFANWARKKFEKEKDPTLAWIEYTFNNYTVYDKFVYNRDPKNNSRPMRVLVLKRRKDEIFRGKSEDRKRVSRNNTENVA